MYTTGYLVGHLIIGAADSVILLTSVHLTSYYSSISIIIIIIIIFKRLFKARLFD